MSRGAAAKKSRSSEVEHEQLQLPSPWRAQEETFSVPGKQGTAQGIGLDDLSRSLPFPNIVISIQK